MTTRSAASGNPPTEIPVPVEWPVCGHRWAVRMLSQALTLPPAQGGGVRHAYLVTGPMQVGKSTLVRAFAQALFCTGERKPCGSCRACLLMQRRAHPDFHVVGPLSKQAPDADELDEKAVPDRVAGKLAFAQARAVVHDANLRPMEGAYKVIHIQDAHRAGDARFMNLLLKTLEEPPPHVILFVTATDRSAILPTVVSRCQVIALQPVDQAAVQQALVAHWNVDAGHSELLARLAGGRIGWAVAQSQKAGLWQERRTRLEQLWALVGAGRLERLARAESMATRNAQLFATLELWQTWWRDVLLTQLGCAEACVNVDCRAQLDQMAAALTPSVVQNYVRTLQTAEAGLRRTVMPRLALDLLLLRLPHVAAAQPG